MKRNREADVALVEIDNIPDLEAHAIELVRSAGAANPDRFVFEIERVGNRGQRLANTEVKDQIINSLVKVIFNLKLIFIGRVAAALPSTGENDETIRFEARLDSHMFGDPVDRRFVASRLAGSSSNANPFQRIIRQDQRPIVFNPTVGGRAIPNGFGAIVPDPTGVFTTATAFSDPASYPVKHLDDYIKQNGEVANAPNSELGLRYWTLISAVRYLCWSLNGNQTYVKNPTFQELAAVIDNDQRLVRNREIDYGSYLPSALDQLLSPYGLNWYVSFENNEPKIKVYERDGDEKKIDLPLAAIGQRNGVDSAPYKWDLNFDLVNKAVNEVHVVGGHHMIESTFELRPGWDVKWDNDLDPRKFTPNYVDPTTGKIPWETDEGFRRAWRDWVLNEAGDYSRNEKWDNDLGKHGHFRSIPKRRRFFPTITQNADGSPLGDSNGTLIEILNPFTGKWINCRGEGGLDDCQNVQVLQSECGIRFSGPNGVPPSIMAFAASFGLAKTRIRITATVESDDSVFAVAGTPLTFLRDRRIHVINLPSKYQKQTVDKTSRLFDGVKDGTYRSSQVDDTEAANQLAQRILQRWNKANMTGEIWLFGLDWDVNIGNRIAGYKPRNLGFNTSPAGADSFPVVTGIRWRFQEQEKHLSLDTYFAPARAVR